MPFIVMTLGFGIVVINALLFALVAKLVDGFYVDGFWSAIGGAIIVSLTTLIANRLLGTKEPPRGPRPPTGGFGGFNRPTPPPRPPEKTAPPGKGDVIDI
jgi:putative membrane protein